MRTLIDEGRKIIAFEKLEIYTLIYFLRTNSVVVNCEILK